MDDYQSAANNFFNSCMQVACSSRQNNKILLYDIGYMSSEPVQVSVLHYSFSSWLCECLWILLLFPSMCKKYRVNNVIMLISVYLPCFCFMGVIGSFFIYHILVEIIPFAVFIEVPVTVVMTGDDQGLRVMIFFFFLTRLCRSSTSFTGQKPVLFVQHIFIL